MTITRVSSREFNQHTNDAKKASKRGPVFITDRGQPAHVLLSIDEYQRLTDSQPTIVELLVMPGKSTVNFKPPRLRDSICRPVNLR